MNDVIELLNHGSIELVASEASDLSVVNSARVSFGKRVNEMNDSDEKLIHYLMKNNHGTPFEHNFISFHVKCPIFVAREWFRHRIGSFNEFSMRYSEIKEFEYFLPAYEDLRTQVGKPGAYHYELIKDQTYTEGQILEIELWLENVEHHQKWASDLYKEGLRIGIAREQARIVFPVAIYTEFYWSVNARSLMNFIGLRNSPDALKEIRDYAVVVEDIFSQLMPITYESFLETKWS